MFFFFYNFFLGICNFWQPYFYSFILFGFFFLLFWFFKYVIRSIVLIRFCTCTYNNSFELRFNLWLHIILYPWLDLSFAREPTSISIVTRTVFEGQPRLRDLLRDSCVPFLLPQHKACPVYEQILTTFMLIFLKIIQRPKTLHARFTSWWR
jgi:hypothetical protein